MEVWLVRLVATTGWQSAVPSVQAERLTSRLAGLQAGLVNIDADLAHLYGQLPALIGQAGTAVRQVGRP